MVSKINSLKPAAENKLMDYEQKEFSRNTVNVVHSFVLNDYGNACLNYFLRFGDREKLEDAIASYINATDIDPQNKVAFYNLHHAYREKYFQSLNEEDQQCQPYKLSLPIQAKKEYLVFDSPSGPGRRISKEGTIEDVLKLLDF